MVDIEPVVAPNGSQNAGVESVQVALTPAIVIDEQNITPPSVQQDDISGSMTNASPKASDKAKSLAISNMKKGGTEASCSNHGLQCRVQFPSHHPHKSSYWRDDPFCQRVVCVINKLVKEKTKIEIDNLKLQKEVNYLERQMAIVKLENDAIRRNTKAMTTVSSFCMVLLVLHLVLDNICHVTFSLINTDGGETWTNSLKGKILMSLLGLRKLSNASKAFRGSPIPWPGPTTSSLSPWTYLRPPPCSL
ncbi:hypothetical protein V2J09_000507 [Rumex salicifolius]